MESYLKPILTVPEKIDKVGDHFPKDLHYILRKINYDLEYASSENRLYSLEKISKLGLYNNVFSYSSANKKKKMAHTKQSKKLDKAGMS